MILFRLLILIGYLFVGGIVTAQPYDNYQRLLMQDALPSEVIGYPYANGFIQFQKFNKNVAQETIAILNINKNKINIEGGISLDEYDYFEDMKIISFEKQPFFFVKLRNHGNSNGHKVKIYFINTNNGKIYPADFVEADSVYSSTLDNDSFIWDQQKVIYEDESITSDFYIWKKDDSHSRPTGGKVNVIYGVELISENKYKFIPSQIIFNGK